MKTLLESIKYNNGMFPRDQLQEIIQRKEEAVPYLLETVKEVLGDPGKYLEDDNTRMDFLYAIYLLSQFRVKEFFPLLVGILSLPGDWPEQLLDDIITEGSGRMLASVYNGDLQALQQIAENTEIDEYIRGQSLHALAVLVLHGQLERERVINYLQQLLTEKLSYVHYIFNTHIVGSCLNLCAKELYEPIRRVYNEDVVEYGMINMDNVERTLKLPLEAALENHRNDPHLQLINDTIDEMQGWACYGIDRKKERPPAGNLFVKAPPVTVEKIGRNDPCPCGSGQKYKKCCGK